MFCKAVLYTHTHSLTKTLGDYHILFAHLKYCLLLLIIIISQTESVPW